MTADEQRWGLQQLVELLALTLLGWWGLYLVVRGLLRLARAFLPG